MAIKFHSGDRVTGLSTDAKPMFAPANSVFYETNTNDTYDFDGSSWTLRAVGLSASDDVTVDGKTQSLADWLILQKTTPTSASTISAVADGKTTATVSWTQKETDKISAIKVDYQLQPDGAWTQATGSATGTSHQVTGLTEDSDYLFRVYPSNIMGQSASATTLDNSINTWIEPTIPQSFQAIADPNGSEGIYCSWNASTSETGGAVTPITYTLERSPDGSSNWTAISTAQSGLTYLDSTNSLDTRYYYRVKSQNSAGTLGYSSTDDHLVPDDPVTSYGNATKNEDGNIAGYDYYRYETIGNSSFTIDDTAEVRVLIVGGGGGGADAQQGGGGSGGVTWTNAYNLSAGTYTVTVGGESGTSSFDGSSATGGTHASASGGTSGTGTLKTGVTGNTYGGYSGGSRSSWVYRGGGGGGATEAGENGSQGGNGGDGVSVTGMEYTDRYYGGGGGASRSQPFGSENLPSYGQGGQGGGGGGSYQNETNGADGTPNTGGGAGAGNSNATVGGSGIVLIRVTM